jgi:type II secretory pathway pseudopilin PulG
LSVVLVIAGIVAGAVALRMGRPMSSARMADALGAIRDFDLTTRSAARAQDRPYSLLADLDRGQFSRSDEQENPARRVSLALPAGCRIERFLVGDQDSYAGEAAIHYSRQGLSPAYAFCLATQGRRQWVAVAGLTGEQVLVENEKEAHDILAAGARPVAH